MFSLFAGMCDAGAPAPDMDMKAFDAVFVAETGARSAPVPSKPGKAYRDLSPITGCADQPTGILEDSASYASEAEAYAVMNAWTAEMESRGLKVKRASVKTSQAFYPLWENSYSFSIEYSGKGFVAVYHPEAVYTGLYSGELEAEFAASSRAAILEKNGLPVFAYGVERRGNRYTYYINYLAGWDNGVKRGVLEYTGPRTINNAPLASDLAISLRNAFTEAGLPVIDKGADSHGPDSRAVIYYIGRSDSVRQISGTADSAVSAKIGLEEKRAQIRQNGAVILETYSGPAEYNQFKKYGYSLWYVNK